MLKIAKLHREKVKNQKLATPEPIISQNNPYLDCPAEWAQVEKSPDSTPESTTDNSPQDKEEIIQELPSANNTIAEQCFKMETEPLNIWDQANTEQQAKEDTPFIL
ncbi:653_t:CDS:1, partial [Dentiscutata heterogama]